MTDLILLTFAAFATSSLTAVLGLGGGMLLLAVMPFYLAPAALIPVHGTVQLASNASRTLFALRHVAWAQLPAFALGSVIGVSLAILLLSHLDLEWLPLAIGLYILCHLWWPAFSAALQKRESFYLIGALQTGLGLLVGATGPLTTTLLFKRLHDKDAVVSTSAIFMSVTHATKLGVYGYLGFAFIDHAPLIAAMASAAVLGSWLGTRLRGKLDNVHYAKILKLVLTLLAMYMILATVLPLVGRVDN